jgi:hypothetical protein
MTHAQSSTPRAALFVAAIGLIGSGWKVAPAAVALVTSDTA